MWLFFLNFNLQEQFCYFWITPSFVYPSPTCSPLPPTPFEFSAFKCCCPFSALNLSGSHFLPLPLLQAIPIPVARKEDSSTLGKHHERAKTDPLLGDHPEWASPTWGLPCLPGHPHPKSEDHCPRPGGGSQEHTRPQVRDGFTLQGGFMLLSCWWW